MTNSLAIALLLAASGCQSLARRGAVPESVVECRQLSQQGVVAMERHAWDKAESLLGRAVESCPIDTDARRGYGEALWHRGAGREAVLQLEQAIHISRHDATLPIRAGEMYLAMNDLARARTKAEQAIELDTRLASAWALRARVNSAEGKLRSGLADYHRALSRAPDDQATLLEIAELYGRLDQPQRALTTLHQLLDTYPPGETSPRGLYLQGLALTALGRYDDSTRSLRRAAAIEASPEVFRRIAQAELLAGRPSSAEQAVRRALAIDPAHDPSRHLQEQIRLARQPRSGGSQRF